MKEKRQKFHIKALIIYVMLICIMFGSGYTVAYWQSSFTQTGVNTNTYDCFNVEYVETNSGVDQLYGFPQSDEEGLNNTPYQIRITNTCKTYVTYKVLYNVLNSSTLSAEYVKIGIDDQAFALNAFSQTSPSLSNAKTAYIISSGGLEQNDSKLISVKSWMDINTTTAQGAGKQFESKITITSTATFTRLASAIKDQDTTDGLYQTTGETVTENGETVYYYKGTTPNNYLKMNNIEFRIIRINEDGSVRIMASNPVGSSLSYNNIASSTYNKSLTSTNGYLAGALHSWYSTNIDNTVYEKYVLQDGKFCNDTSNSSSAAKNRLVANTPTFKCAVTPLSMNVGVITLDEYIFAGEDESYLYGNTYWTMSPYNATSVYVINTTSTNGISYKAANENGNLNVYPVLNLSKDTKIVGTGTKTDPFIVQED